jgi:hypothetical protein
MLEVPLTMNAVSPLWHIVFSKELKTSSAVLVLLLLAGISKV